MRSSINPSIRLGISLRARPCEVYLIFIISLHKCLVEKYVKIHKIYVIYFDHVTRFLCSDWLKCSLQCDTALVITLSVSVLH